MHNFTVAIPNGGYVFRPQSSHHQAVYVRNVHLYCVWRQYVCPLSYEDRGHKGHRVKVRPMVDTLITGMQFSRIFVYPWIYLLFTQIA